MVDGLDELSDQGRGCDVSDSAILPGCGGDEQKG